MILPRHARAPAAAWHVAAALLTCLHVAAGRVDAQLQVATVGGVTLDVHQQPVPAATVLLQDLTGETVRSAASGADGSFLINDVAPGAYVIRVQFHGTTVVTQPLVVRGSLPIHVKLQAGLTLRDEVIVRGDAGRVGVERPWSLAGDAVRGNSEGLPGQRLQGTIGSLPGWTIEDNGLLHVRGVDDGLLYVQDGIPIYERIDRLFGVAPNPSGIASIHVINGYIPPEFGLKSGGVIEVRSETGLRDAWSGGMEAGAGGFATRHVSALAAGPMLTAGALMLTAASERTSRFLDPVDPANLHNDGRTVTAGAQWTWRPAVDLFSASVQGAESLYDVPHSETQDAAGQDQEQRVGHWLVSGSWQRVLSSSTVWQVSAYARRGRATLYGSPADTPVTLDAERANRRHGAMWSLTYQRGRHTFKTGGELSALRLDERFMFAVTNPDAGEAAGLSEGAMGHDPSSAFTFAATGRPTIWSGYAQDVVQASNRLTLNFGVRFDRSRLLAPASQWSPRLGVAYQLFADTTLRASFMRLFQPPQTEYLLLASSSEARALSPFADGEEGGGSTIRPERLTAFDAAVSQQLPGGWQLEAGAWRRRVRDVSDPNVFFGTTITVPNSVARQQAWGFELRLDMPPRRGWSASAGYTRSRVVQFGPITGGLFLEDEYLEIRNGTRFTPDHDQRHALGVSGTYRDERRHWQVSAVFRYQTGTPLGLEVEEDDLDETLSRAGSEVVDVASGRVRPRAVADLHARWTFHRGARAMLSLGAWVNNVTDARYAYNFGNPFSGTHFGATRHAGASLTVRFGRSNP